MIYRDELFQGEALKGAEIDIFEIPEGVTLIPISCFNDVAMGHT